MTTPGARFAARVFLWAGLYGLVCLMPQYFLEARIATDAPPPITHPEYFYGFVGVGIAWQLAFLAISRDPVRMRLLMLPAVVEKYSFAGSTFGLYLAGRAAGPVAFFAAIDLVLGTLFLVAFFRTRGEAA